MYQHTITNSLPLPNIRQLCDKTKVREIGEKQLREFHTTKIEKQSTFKDDEKSETTETRQTRPTSLFSAFVAVSEDLACNGMWAGVL